MKDHMKDERLMILEMVKEGKISPDDATKLLNSLQGCKVEDSIEFDVEEKFNKFCNSMEVFAKDMKDKLGHAFKEAEPTVKKATKKAMEKTICVLDDVSKSLNESVKNMDQKEADCCGGDNCCEEEKKDE